jgi:glycerol 3-phosphatase-2
VIIGSPLALATQYDVALLDLDGVVYVGPDPVPGAPDALAQARVLGMRLAFVTNNAARSAQSVAEHLSALGIAATAEDVITSSQTAAHYLADRVPAGSRVLVAGTTGLTEALIERGLVPVFSADDDPVALVQGYSPDADWRMLAEAAVAIRRGLLWVATNLDATLPSPRGPLPGNGSLVAALRHATGATPVAVGKPEPTMHRETVERSHAERPVVVGDRLDTDIQGARTVGCASLLVFSGVTTPAEVLAAPSGQRPDYLAADVSGLLRPHPAVRIESDHATCGAWTVSFDEAGLTLSGSDRPDHTAPAKTVEGDDRDSDSSDGSDISKDDGYDALRALCDAAWTAASAPPTGAMTAIRAADERAATELKRYGLA